MRTKESGPASLTPAQRSPFVARSATAQPVPQPCFAKLQ